MVDIHFDGKKSIERQVMYSELCSFVFEKEELLDLSQRADFQLLETIRKNESAVLSYNVNQKIYLIMSKKVFIAFYLKHIRFLMKRVGRVVTKAHPHYSWTGEV